MSSDAVLNLRIPAALKTGLAKAAEENMRSMSGMAVWAISEWLKQNGYAGVAMTERTRAPRRRERK